MPLVFAEADKFTETKKTSMPSLPGDIVAIELPLYKGRILKGLSPSECKSHFKYFNPSLFIILSKTKKPRYSSFPCEVNSYIPIELTPETQYILLNLVNKSAYEVSGRISRKGEIDNIKKGTADWVPAQPQRTREHISFHVHPYKTYKKYNTNYGWPSSVDMKKIQYSPDTTNSHIIPSAEGIYLISSKTCEPPPKEKISVSSFNKMLEKCSWLLLPWKLNKSWYVY